MTTDIGQSCGFSKKLAFVVNALGYGFNKIPDLDFMAIGDIYFFSSRFCMLINFNKASGSVLNINKIPRLVAVAENYRRLTGK